MLNSVTFYLPLCHTKPILHFFLRNNFITWMGGFNTMKTQMLLKYNCRIILYWEKIKIIQNYISAFQMWPHFAKNLQTLIVF